MASLSQGRSLGLAATTCLDYITIFGAGCSLTIGLGCINMRTGSGNHFVLTAHLSTTVFTVNYQIISTVVCAGCCHLVLTNSFCTLVTKRGDNLVLAADFLTASLTTHNLIVGSIGVAIAGHFIFQDNLTGSMTGHRQDGGLRLTAHTCHGNVAILSAGGGKIFGLGVDMLTGSIDVIIIITLAADLALISGIALICTGRFNHHSFIFMLMGAQFFLQGDGQNDSSRFRLHIGNHNL